LAELFDALPRLRQAGPSGGDSLSQLHSLGLNAVRLFQQELCLLVQVL
jgi:hypothetical protein